MVSHNYIFFSTDSSFSRLSSAKQKTYKNAFLEIIKKEKKVITYFYATLGLKKDTSILLWFQAETIEVIQIFLNQLMHTELGRYLHITYTLFGMVRPTQYSTHAKHLLTLRKGGKYLIIYPFTKTNIWYELDFETRRKLMGGHVMIGKKYHQKISQLLLYSYGIDDSEFIVSYETDDLLAFQSLVMELRTDKVRAYTFKDTPIFTCIYKTPKEILEFL